MESLVEVFADSRHGFAVFALGILVLLLALVIIQVIKLVVGVYADRAAAREKSEEKEKGKTDSEITEVSIALRQNTEMVRELRIQLGVLERELNEVKRFKSDSDSLFTAVKILAGKKWPAVSRAIQSEREIRK